MCLLTKLKQPLVAEKDIVVYKFLDDLYHDGFLYSSIRRSKYVLNKVYETKLVKKRDSIKPELYCIYNGYHAFSTLIGAKLHKDYGRYIYKAIIPKGSLYYTPIKGCNDIVSNKIIIKRKLWFNIF